MTSELVSPIDILKDINNYKGLMWDKIAAFRKKLELLPSAILPKTETMEEYYPLEHNIKDGLYTRKVSMPKGHLVVSFIHKQSHPSFFLKGEMSILKDDGTVERIKAPMVIQTEIGTQRVAFMHEDCEWACVYKVDTESIEEAEKQIYTYDYKNLPKELISKTKVLCQE